MTQVKNHDVTEAPRVPDPDGDISWRRAPHIALSGLCMGTADLVPGVSGGTMAVALGIYREFLAAITSVNTSSLRALVRGQVGGVLRIVHWRFIASLMVGMFIAFVIMGKVLRLPQLVSDSPRLVYSVFFGLVLASIVVLLRRLERWTLGAIISLPVGALLGYLVVTLVPVGTPEHPLFIFLCGVVAISAMILPGISGSFILLVLGKYEHIIGGVLELNLGIAVPFALGCAIGIAAFARVLGKLLDKFPNGMIAGLTGLLVGSLVRIWPYQHLETAVIREKKRVISAEAFFPESLDSAVLVLIALGLLFVLVIEFAAAARQNAQRA